MGLFDGQGALTPLGMVVEDAANYLAMQGWLDPDADEYPPETLAELTAIAQEDPCGPLCHTTQDGHLHPSMVAEHFLTRRQEEWERSLPIRTCTCSRAYKVLYGQGNGSGDAYHDIRGDGLLGDIVGYVKRGTKSQIKHSDVCPACNAASRTQRQPGQVIEANKGLSAPDFSSVIIGVWGR